MPLVKPMMMGRGMNRTAEPSPVNPRSRRSTPAIMVTITGAVFSVLNPSNGIFQAQPEVVDCDAEIGTTDAFGSTLPISRF